MRGRWWMRLAFPAGAAAMLASAAPPAEPAVLVFSYSTGFRHDSIAAGVASLTAMGARRGFRVTASEDPAIFDRARLAGYRAIVLLSTTSKRADPASEWFVGDRRTALQRFVRRGGGIVAIHAAADSHYHWPWYGRLIGARFRRHPAGTPEGAVTLSTPRHPAAAGLESPVRRVDEWYLFDGRDAAAPAIAMLDAGSIGQPGPAALPMAWAHRFEGGRVFYTAMGHTAASFAEPWFVRHLEGGVDWALRRR